MCATDTATMHEFSQRICPKRAFDRLDPVFLRKVEGQPSSESGLMFQNGIGTASGFPLREGGRRAGSGRFGEKTLGADQAGDFFHRVEISMVQLALKRIPAWRMS